MEKPGKQKKQLELLHNYDNTPKKYIKPCATAEAEAVPDVLMGVKWEWTFDDSKSLQAQVWKQTTKWASGYTSESTMKLV